MRAGLLSIAVVIGCASAPPPIVPPEPPEVAFRGMQATAKPPAPSRPSSEDPGPPLTGAEVLSQLPGAGWHCFSAWDRPRCVRTPPRCAELHDAYLAELGPTKVAPCAPRGAAFCYGTHHEYGRYGRIDCTGSRESCEAEVLDQRKKGRVITSDCIEVP